MTPEESGRRRTLLATLESLYARLQEGTLRDTDYVDIEEVSWPDYEAFVARLHSDPVEFRAHFDSFMRPFEVFRRFAEWETVLDVGAHWGYSALAMRHQGCRARILSIEALPFNIPPLETLSQIEGATYDYLNVAVSDRQRELTFYVPVLNGCGAGGLASTGGTLTPTFAVTLVSRVEFFPTPAQDGSDDVRIAVLKLPALPIDVLVETPGNRGQRIAAVKMDVEGHEAAALAGASRLLQTQRPFLMVEGGTRFQAVVDILTAHGYFCAGLSGGQLHSHEGPVRAGDGFWVHPEQVDRYRQLGLFAGD